jgi:hypothetical protein
MSRFSKVVLIGSVAILVAFAALLYHRLRFATPTGKLEITTSGANSEPEQPGEPAPIKFAEPNMSSPERQTFLAGEYTVLRKVADLPRGIQRLYAVNGGSRIAMADPGERFESTDVITDPMLPTRRLIFAGVAQNRAFVHYEEGGIAHYYVTEHFRLEPPQTAVGVWRGYCGPAKSFEELRQLAEHCNHFLQCCSCNHSRRMFAAGTVSQIPKNSAENPEWGKWYATKWGNLTDQGTDMYPTRKRRCRSQRQS